MIPLIAPTSDAARIEVVLSRALAEGLPRAFVYYVSVTGVTGADLGASAGESRASALATARAEAETIRDRFGAPVVIGFGIDGAARAREASGPFGRGADGVVVGTALVTRIERGASAEERSASVRALLGEIRAALDAE